MWVPVTELRDCFFICIMDCISINNFDALIILVGTQDANDVASCALDLTFDVVEVS